MTTLHGVSKLVLFWTQGNKWNLETNNRKHKKTCFTSTLLVCFMRDAIHFGLRRICVRYSKWIEHTWLEIRNSMMNFWHMMPNERSAQLSKTAVASDWELSLISLNPCIQKKNCKVWWSCAATIQWCVQYSQPDVATLQWNMLSSRPHVAALQWCMHSLVGQMLQHCNGACTVQ
jgi:hypothetical protein